MVGKTPLVLAPLIVGAAMLFGAFWLGRLAERVRGRFRASLLDPVLYGDVVGFVRRVLTPADLVDPPYLPQVLREEGQQLVAREAERLRRVEQVELRRRRGF